MRNLRRPSTSDHLPRPCPQCGFPDSLGAGQHLRRQQEDRDQFESLRRAVTRMINEAGASEREVLEEVMFRLEIPRPRQRPAYAEFRAIDDPRFLEPTRMPRMHPDWDRWRGGGFTSQGR